MMFFDLNILAQVDPFSWIFWNLVRLAISLGLSYGLAQLTRKKAHTWKEPHLPDGWEPQTVQRADIPIDLVYGTTLCHGNVIGAWTQPVNKRPQEDTPNAAKPKVLRSRHLMTMRLGWSDGPISGPVANTLTLNGQHAADLESETEDIWTDLSRMYSQDYIYALCNVGDGIALAGTAAGGRILRSLDYGETWANLGQQASQTEIRCLIYLGGGIALAGTATGGKILRSTDSGATWSDLGTMYSQTYIFSLCNVGGGIVLAGTYPNGKVLRSTDYGATWSDLGTMYSQISIRSLVSLGGGICLAGTAEGGLILRSTDSGATWSNLGQQASQTHIFSLCNVGGGIVLAGTFPDGKILRSTNYGATWSDLGQQFSQSGIRCFLNVGSGVVLAGTTLGSKILQSTDSGATWTDLEVDIGTGVYSLASLDGRHLVAGTGAQGRILIQSAGLEVTDKLGTDLQTATDAGDVVELPQGYALLTGEPVTISLSDTDYDGLGVTICSQEGLCKFDAKDGSQRLTGVTVLVEMRIAGGAWQTLANCEHYGKTSNPVRFRFLNTGCYTGGTPFTVTRGTAYEIRVTCDKVSGTRYRAAFFVEAVQQFYTDGHALPGLAYTQIRALNTDKLNRTLVVDNVIAGKIVESANTGGSIGFSALVPDVVKDILCRPVISGDGSGTAYAVDYYRGYDPSEKLNATEFDAFYDYCAASVSDGKGGTEARWSFNGRIAETSARFELASKIAAYGRGNIWYDGNKIRIWIDQVATPSHIFCCANTLKGTYKEISVDKRKRPSAIEATILNAAAGYNETPIRFTDTSVTHDRVQQIDGNGITSIGQFVRLARFICDKTANMDLLYQWGMDVAGLDVRPGEVAYIQDDSNGRSTGGCVVSAAGSIVVIDKSVTMEGGHSYKLVVQTIDAGGKHVTAYDVASVAGGTSVTLTAPLTYVPIKGDAYIFSDVLTLDQVRVVATGADPQGRVTLAGEQYKAAYYANDAVAPTFDTTTGLTSAKTRQASWKAVSRQDLFDTIPDEYAFSKNEAPNAAWGMLTFTGDSVDTVTWTGDDASEGDTGWVRIDGQMFRISADAVGTTDRYIYADKAAWDEDGDNTLSHTNDRAGVLAGQERYVVCENIAGVAYPRNGYLVSADETKLDGIEAGADVTEAHAADIIIDSATAPAHGDGFLWRNPNWCGQDCVAHWRMNDAAANTRVKDESPNANHGTAQQNTSALTAAGKVGTGLTQNGSTDFITVADAPSLDFGTGDFSGCGWIKSSYTAAIQRLICKLTAGAIGFEFYLAANGDLAAVVGDSGGYTTQTHTPASSIRDGAWHFVGFSVDRNGNSYFYVDGTLSAAKSFTTRSGSIDNTEPLYLGIYRDGSTEPFNGTLDNMMLFDRALTKDDFDALYDASTGTEAIGLGSPRMLHRSDGTYWLLADSDSPTIPRSAAEVPETSDRKWAGETGADVTANSPIETFRETFENPNNDVATRWVNYQGSGEMSIESGGLAGGKFLRVGNNAGNDQLRLIYYRSIPFNPTKKYRLRARVRHTAGAGKLYAGVAGRNAADTAWVNKDGLDLYTDQHYILAYDASPAATWTEYTGYLKGSAATGTITACPDPAAPGQLQQTACYIRPMMILNFSGVAGTMEVDEFTVDIVPEDADQIAPSSTKKWAAETGATRNQVSSGAASPSGGENGDLYYETDIKAWWSKISGVWTKVSDETAANIAAGITGQGALATLNTVGTAQIDNTAVTVDKLATNAVTTPKIIAEAVTTLTSIYDDDVRTLYHADYDKFTVMAETAEFTAVGTKAVILATGATKASYGSHCDAWIGIFRRKSSDTSLSIDSISLASTNVRVSFASAHGLSDGDAVWITGVVGTVELNQGIYYITVIDSDTIELGAWFFGGALSSHYSAYTSGGTVKLVTSVYWQRHSLQPGTDATTGYAVSAPDTSLVAASTYQYLCGVSSGAASTDGSTIEATLTALETKR